MRISLRVLLMGCLLGAAPAFAGNLTFEGGQPIWHSAQCVKPNPPNSVLAAGADTSGETMNTLVDLHNAYVDAAQAYMNCISSEAERDQSMVGQAIATGAQKAISSEQTEVESAEATLRSH